MAIPPAYPGDVCAPGTYEILYMGRWRCIDPEEPCGHGCGHGHPHQFLICTRCGATAEIADQDVAHALTAAAGRLGFRPSRATVEVEGICARCA